MMLRLAGAPDDHPLAMTDCHDVVRVGTDTHLSADSAPAMRYLAHERDAAN